MSYGYSGSLPDVVRYLQNETNLTRRTIVEILTGKRQDAAGEWQTFDEYGSRLADFKKNPQVFMEGATKIIRSVMKSLIVDGIRYQRIDDGEYYAQGLFESEELKGYLESNMTESRKGLYNYVVYDSENERRCPALCKAAGLVQNIYAPRRVQSKLGDYRQQKRREKAILCT